MRMTKAISLATGFALLAIAIVSCSSDGVIDPPVIDPRPECIDDVQNGIYRGVTSQGEIFEMSIENKSIRRFHFETSQTRPICSSIFGCPISAQTCVTITQEPLHIDPVTCEFSGDESCMGGLGLGGALCSTSSCPLITGIFDGQTASGDFLDAGRIFGTPSSCFLSTGDLTWSASFIPGVVIETDCQPSPAAEVMERTEPGRTVIRHLF